MKCIVLPIFSLLLCKIVTADVCHDFELDFVQYLKQGDHIRSNNKMGSVMAYHDGLLAATAPLDDQGKKNVGSVNVFRNVMDTWLLIHSVTPPKGTAAGIFGNSVAISKDYLVVGAHRASCRGKQSGTVFVYRLLDTDRYELLKQLHPPYNSNYDYYGTSVTVIQENEKARVCVGAPGDDDAGTNAGAVYCYDIDVEDNITYSAKLTDTMYQPDHWEFGAVVKFSDLNTVYISSPKAKTGSQPQEGKISAFTYELHYYDLHYHWRGYVVASAPYGYDGTRFGESFDICPDTGDLVIGAPGFNVGASKSGAIFLQRRKFSNSLSKIELVQEKPTKNAQLGTSVVAVSEDEIIAGVPTDDKNKGKIVVFRRDQDYVWSHTQTLKKTNAKKGDRFGQQIAITDEGNLLVAAPEDDKTKSNSGTIFEYVHNYGDCNKAKHIPNVLNWDCDTLSKDRVSSVHHAKVTKNTAYAIEQSILDQFEEKPKYITVTANIYFWGNKIDKYPLFSIKSDANPDQFLEIWIENNKVNYHFSGYEPGTPLVLKVPNKKSFLLELRVSMETNSLYAIIDGVQTGRGLILSTEHGKRFLPSDPSTKVWVSSDEVEESDAAILQLYLSGQGYSGMYDCLTMF